MVSAGMLDETVGHGPSVIWPSRVWAEETTALTAETTPRTAPFSMAVLEVVDRRLEVVDRRLEGGAARGAQRGQAVLDVGQVAG